MADTIEKTTLNTPKDLQEPWKQAPATVTGNYEVLGSSQLKYTIIARQERESGELSFPLLPIAIMVSVPKGKQVTARTPAAAKKIGIAHVSASSGPKDHAG
jgi:hypothetical protein